MKRAVGLRPQPNKNTQLAQPLNWGVKVSPLLSGCFQTRFSLDLESSLLSVFGFLAAVVFNEK